jgi:hypothetical protein
MFSQSETIITDQKSNEVAMKSVNPKRLARDLLSEMGLPDGPVLEAVLMYLKKNLDPTPTIVMSEAVRHALGLADIENILTRYLDQEMILFGPHQCKISIRDYLTVGRGLWRFFSHEKEMILDASTHHGGLWQFIYKRVKQYIADPFQEIMDKAIDELDYLMMPYIKIDRQMFSAYWAGDLDRPFDGTFDIVVQTRPCTTYDFKIDDLGCKGYELNLLYPGGHPYFGIASWHDLWDPERMQPWEKEYYNIYVSTKALKELYQSSAQYGEYQDAILQGLYRQLNHLGPVESQGDRLIYDLRAWDGLHLKCNMGRVYLKVYPDIEKLLITEYLPPKLTEEEKQSILAGVQVRARMDRKLVEG